MGSAIYLSHTTHITSEKILNARFCGSIKNL